MIWIGKYVIINNPHFDFPQISSYAIQPRTSNVEILNKVHLKDESVRSIDWGVLSYTFSLPLTDVVSDSIYATPYGFLASKRFLSYVDSLRCNTYRAYPIKINTPKVTLEYFLIVFEPLSLNDYVLFHKSRFSTGNLLGTRKINENIQFKSERDFFEYRDKLPKNIKIYKEEIFIRESILNYDLFQLFRLTEILFTPIAKEKFIQQGLSGLNFEDKSEMYIIG